MFNNWQFSSHLSVQYYTVQGGKILLKCIFEPIDECKGLLRGTCMKRAIAL